MSNTKLNVCNDMINFKYYESYIELLIYYYYNNDYLKSYYNKEYINIDMHLERIDHILKIELAILPKHHELIESFRLYHTKFTRLKRELSLN